MAADQLTKSIEPLLKLSNHLIFIGMVRIHLNDMNLGETGMLRVLRLISLFCLPACMVSLEHFSQPAIVLFQTAKLLNFRSLQSLFSKSICQLFNRYDSRCSFRTGERGIQP